MIYFVQAGEIGPIKIGLTEISVGFRVAGIQVGCPQSVIVLGTMAGGGAAEKRLHRLFAAYHLRGEWFHPHPRLTAAIAELADAPPIQTFDDIRHPVKRGRLKLGLTQDQLGEMIGIKAPHICAIESGRKLPSLEAASRLSRALKMPLDELASALFAMHGQREAAE